MKQVDSGQSFFSWFSTSGSKDNIWFCALVSGCPVDVAEAVSNEFSCFIDGEPLETWMLGSNQHVDAFTVTESHVRDSEQGVRVGWQVFLDHVWTFLFVKVRQQTWILVSVTVVVLLEDRGSVHESQCWVVVTPVLFLGLT